MRRVARILSAALAAASLLLFVAVLCLWPRTTRLMDTVSFLTHSDTQYSAGTCPHALFFSVGHNLAATQDPHDPQKTKLGWSFSSLAPGSTRSYSWSEDLPSSGTSNYSEGIVGHTAVIVGSGPDRNRLGFGWQSATSAVPRPPYTAGAGTVTVSYKNLAIPLWFVGADLIIWPVVFLTRQMRRRRRVRLGHCLQCGYDLRASSSRCPECGTPVPNPSLEVGS